MKNKSLLIYTCCDNKYAMFIPIFILSHCIHNDGCSIEIGTSLKESECTFIDVIKLLQSTYTNCKINVIFEAFQVRNNKAIYDGNIMQLNTVRFIRKPNIECKYVYITDIDIINTEPILEKHISIMNKFNSNYSNIVRPSGKSLSGLHFSEYNVYYPINKTNINLSINDEEILFNLVNNKIGVNYKIDIRPVHGIHVSLSRQPFNKVGWELDKHTKEEWSTIKNNQLYNMCLISPYLVNVDNIISNYYS